jgi:uncharacterized damage-inducible protein DinB
MNKTELANFFENWDRVHKQTLKIMKVSPVEKFDWRPADSAMTLGELLRHFPESERFLVGMITNRKIDEQDLCALKTVDEVIAHFDRIHESCKKSISELPESEFNETIQFGPAEMLKRVLLQGMCEHEIHHRGQLYTYVRIAGVIPPPLFGDL